MKVSRAEFLRWLGFWAAGASLGCVGNIRTRDEDGNVIASGQGRDGMGGASGGHATAGSGAAARDAGTIVIADSGVESDSGRFEPPDAGTQPPPEGALVQYPAITLAEIAEAWPGFEQTLPPVLVPDAPVIQATVAQLASVAAANHGRQIRVTNSDPNGNLQLMGAVDVEILIPDDIEVGLLQVDSGCLRVRVRGEGANSRVHAARVSGASHTTFHSLLLPGSEYSPAMRVVNASGPTAFISCIAGSGNAPSFDIGLQVNSTDILFANCNMGADGNDGMNDWCLRFGESHRVVMVDCFCESRGRQPVIRRSSGSSQFLFKRVTTYNAVDAEAFADNGVGNASYIQRDCFLYDCVSYLGGDGNSFRFGGYNLGPADHSAVWRVYNHSFHALVSNPVGEATLANIERNAPSPGNWQYRLGAPRYNPWDGTHPGWPERIGFTGVAMAISDPYRL